MPGSTIPIHYLPHRAVVKDGKQTSKVRIVYDASCKVSKHSPSLNQCLYKGPTMIPMIFDILVRFRTYPYALVFDIEKAFLQVKIHEDERDSL